MLLPSITITRTCGGKSATTKKQNMALIDFRNLGIVIGFIIFFSCTYILASEYLTLIPSKGEVLVFRRGVKRPLAAPRDEESNATNFPIPHHQAHASSSTQEVEKDVNSGKPTIAFHWRNLCYDITIKGENRRILNNVNGWVKPGTLTALMVRKYLVYLVSPETCFLGLLLTTQQGATGAGKTTLLDVLADRVTMGIVTGDVLLNGHPRGNSFQRKTGYVQQQDIHLETSTVREALIFSAELRQPPTVSQQDKLAHVEEILRLLEMDNYADAVVGVPGEGEYILCPIAGTNINQLAGLNVEQRKRLTIGVELAGKPEFLVFLDEPTSGLDSQTAWSIATLIRKLANHGQAILCTIHQPSAILFQQFDRLLLLAKGGNTVYFGDIGQNSRTMIDYFEKYGAPSCGEDENPAEWMLHAIGAAPGAHTDRDWPQTWRESSEFTAAQKELEQLAALKATTPNPEGGPEFNTTYAATFQQQLWTCTKRVFQQYWRTPSYIYAKLGLCLGTVSFFSI